MATINQLKTEQHEEETSLLEDLAKTKLEALWAELDLARRNVRLTDDESSRLLLGVAFAFAAQQAVENGNTRDEFIHTIGLTFDDILEELSDDGDEDPMTDKGPQEGAAEPPPSVTVA